MKANVNQEKRDFLQDLEILYTPFPNIRETAPFSDEDKFA